MTLWWIWMLRPLRLAPSLRSQVAMSGGLDIPNVLEGPEVGEYSGRPP